MHVQYRIFVQRVPYWVRWVCIDSLFTNFDQKPFLQLIKEKNVTFEDDMPNIKTKMNHNLLTQKLQSSKHMEYFIQTLGLIVRIIKLLRMNTMKKGAIFAIIYI